MRAWRAIGTGMEQEDRQRQLTFGPRRRGQIGWGQRTCYSGLR